ncbi:type II secretion system F family protein [Halobaculum sp. P14]|uniref:type II secretion system F family protein n=1 Tax=Halobaculum sp. P14 TaxID=3421638 RepID=UPI003EBEBDE6
MSDPDRSRRDEAAAEGADSRTGTDDSSAAGTAESDADEHGPATAEPLSFGIPERHPSLSERRLREEYGRLQGYFRYRADDYRGLAAALRANRSTNTVDEYLARSVRLAAAATAGGALAGVLFAALLAASMAGSLGGAALLAVGVALSVGGAVVAGAGVWLGRRWYPTVRARQRARRADLMLPHAVIFLYALSHGGMNLLSVSSRLADARDVYREPAAAFDDVVADVTWFDRSLLSALTAARERTPGDATSSFFDELVAVVETGGDVDSFLETEADRHLELAAQKQEQLLDDLETLAEVYVTVVFAGPIFLLVTLLVVSFVRAGLLLPLRLLVYGVIPAAVVAVGFGVSYLYEPYRQQLGEARDGVTAAASLFESSTHEDERVAAYERSRRRERWRRILTEPVELMRERPAATLLVTVPVGAAAVAALLGVVGSFTTGPAVRSAVLFTVPFLVAAAPFSYAYHRKRSYERSVRRRFPDALEILADADENGVPLAESFGLVAARTSGDLATELERVSRDIDWTDDVGGALDRFESRLGVPSVTRVVRLVRETVNATDDLAPVFSIVAEDLETRNDLRARRQRQMRPYAFVAVIGVLVFLGIVLFFESHFLPAIAEFVTSSDAGLSGTSLSVGTVDTTTYRRLFVHATLIQAVTNGLLVGKLVDDRVASGVKYAAALAAVCTVALVAVM